MIRDNPGNPWFKCVDPAKIIGRVVRRSLNDRRNKRWNAAHCGNFHLRLNDAWSWVMA